MLLRKASFALSCLLAMSLVESALAETRTELADGIRGKAAVSFTGQYEVAAPVAKVRAALQRPLMMGMLWESYQYGPGYKVSALAEPRAVHVIDPSGIVGDVWPVSSTGDRLVYVARGNLNHWAVPVMNKGSAVFDLGLAPQGAGTQVTVTVFLRPENQIAGAALWLLTPIAKARINSRVTNNFHDATNILMDISSAPQGVAERLKGDVRQEFERAFVGNR